MSIKKRYTSGSYQCNAREQGILGNMPSLVCVVPARNEEGHLPYLVDSIIGIEEVTTVVIVEGGSTDNTLKVAQELARKNVQRVKYLQQSGKGKFNAVLEGALLQKSDFVMVWDADGTVPKESAKKIIDTAISQNAFSMGDRLRGQIQPGAMQPANKLGNWIFAILWAPLLKVRPSDIFCGTKVAPSAVFHSLLAPLTEKDPYGDITLLMSARSLGIKIESVPVDYLPRVYGESKMRRWRTGIRFLQLTKIAYSLALKQWIQKI